MANNKNPLCINEMQVHSIVQETDDVVTLNLIAQDFYPYQAGQYALVSIRNSEEVARAYTLSSTPGLSPFLSITVRRIENGVGSNWLTREVKVGDQIWLSDPMGDFSCEKVIADKYLLAGGGSGITPIISMTRHLLAHRPEVDLTVIYSIHSPKDMIFKEEWQAIKAQYPHLKLHINASVNALDGFIAGRISTGMINHFVPDMAERTVMVCGPEGYIETLQEAVQTLGGSADRFFVEKFFLPELTETIDESKQVRLSIRNPQLQTYNVPVGMSLLNAMEAHKLPVVAACRSGVCGSCKTKVVSGSVEVVTNGPLTADEIAQGYVLACSCKIRGDVEVAKSA